MEDKDYTLEEMRAQYQALEETLAKQEIINDRLLRETMKTKVRSIRSTATVSVICGLFVIITAPFVFHYNPVVNASWYFVAATELLMTFAIFLDWKFNHKVQSSNLKSCDLLTFSRHVKELREDYSGWLKWGLLLGTLWASWLCWEVWQNTAEPKLAIAMITGLLIGLITGGIVGWRMTRRIINTCDDIISQIEG